MRRSSKKLNQSLKKEIVKTLAQAVTDFGNVNETELFLTNFLNESELEVLAKRLAVAYWLKKGRSYTNIKDNLKVSSATIASIQEAMKAPGFQQVLKKVEAEEWASEWSEKIKKFVGK